MSCATVSFTGGGLKFWLEAYSTTTQDTVSFTPKVSATNVCAAIVPKGTGAIVASIPNGLASGGNARGQYAVDLQTFRTNANEVSSGGFSVICGGRNNRSAGADAVIVGGNSNIVTNQRSFIGGGTANNLTTLNGGVICGGESNSTSANGLIAIVGGASNYAAGAHNFIGGGQSNSAGTGSHIVITGGQSNTASATHSFIGGGNNNNISATGATRSVIVGGLNNTISSSNGINSFIGGGSTNVISNGTATNTIVGGFDNQINPTANEGLSFIGGGSGHRLGTSYSVIVGGRTNTQSNNSQYYQTISGGYANSSSQGSTVIAGGTNNTTSGTYGSIGGGQSNTASGSHSSVGGGQSNTSGSTHDVVCGGQSNGTGGNNNSFWKFIGGGSNNTVSGDQTSYSGIACGNANQITSGRFAFIGGGRSNTINSGGWDSTIGGGQSNYANGNNQNATHTTISGGFGNTTFASYSFIGGGSQAITSLYGQFAHASGQFSAQGDAQSHELIWRREITGTAQTELFLDGASIRAILPGTNSVWKGIINFAAVCTVQGTGTTGVGSVAAIDYSVTIKRIGTSTVLIAANNLSPLDSDGGMGTSTFDISADNTNEALAIKFTPPGTAAADTVIRVVATFRGTQIKY